MLEVLALTYDSWHVYISSFSYDIYLEMVEGDINQTFKDDNIVEFWTVCDLFSNHMLKYNPTHRKYEDGTNMRPAIQKH